MTGECNQLASKITENIFGSMRISDFLQQGIPELDAKMYLFKITEQVAVAIMTQEILERILMSVNKIIQEYELQ
ncbi:MAG: hypothetical protein ACFFCD_02705 [Promethearchaeota archaeon]